MKLYHGSSMPVENPLAEIGRNNLDFGKGFYTTRLKEQAQKWGGLVASRKSPDAIGVVSTYECDEDLLVNSEFCYKQFNQYDMEWLDFVVSCRQGMDDTEYDIVEGGVANDQVIDTVEDYENNRITAEQALDQLRYKKPNNQICFRSQKAINHLLRFVESEEI